MTTLPYAEVGLVSVDPGVHAHGVALWESGELRGATYAQATSVHATLDVEAVSAANAVVRWLRGFCGGELAVVEVPRSYDVQHQKGDQNDLVWLAFSAGVLLGTLGLPHTRLVTPAEWKRQVPKEVAQLRYQHALTEVERGVLARALEDVPAREHHNVWDAVGLGLWVLRRVP